MLYQHFGPRNWWPGETSFEVVVGAILTQSVAWRNVEKAIANLKGQGLLDPLALLAAPDEQIEEAVRPTRYYRMKTKKLKAFCRHLVEEYDGDLAKMFAKPWPKLREELLGVWGLGPETVDSILLYAGEKPTFVVDAYTKRIWARLGVHPEDIDYEELRAYFMDRLPEDVALYNEFHALIDGVGNRYCKAKNPKCGDCPLAAICCFPTGGEGEPGVEK
ncbi:MAG: endonuclease III domain-containing protein [Firmicutes bacterium]|nr:endonuclease III domain-containing protein [Bacillota bacterium]